MSFSERLSLSALAQFRPVHLVIRYQVRLLLFLRLLLILRFSRLRLLHFLFLFFFFLFHFFCLFKGFIVAFLFYILRFRLLPVFRSVHLVRREHFRVCRRVFQQILDDRQHRIALAVQPGYYADFARLLVADDQHVFLVFLFLFHFRCF